MADDVDMNPLAAGRPSADAEHARVDSLERTVARLVADLSRCRGVHEAVIRLEHGLPAQIAH